MPNAPKGALITESPVTKIIIFLSLTKIGYTSRNQLFKAEEIT